MITKTYPKLTKALSKESWEYLQDNYPDIADALAAEVATGADPAAISRFVMRMTGREAIAARLEQAAGYLAGEE